MFDLKALKTALEQLESERNIPKAKILEAIEDALAAAYKKDYGKKGQVVKARFDLDTGDTSFVQVKTIVDESTVRMEEGEDEEEETPYGKPHGGRGVMHEPTPKLAEGEVAPLPRYNSEQHLLLEDARMMKKDARLGEELVFALENKQDYGRIAAQTAKQVIMQRIREAEREAVMGEYESRKGQIVSGTVQRMERGALYVDLGRAIGIIFRNEQIPGEYFKPGDRIRAYLYAIEEMGRELTIKLSRSHPQFIQKLFEMEVPEIGNGAVEIKAIAREPGSRSKVAVTSHDEHIDPVGSCVGQGGVRVNTVTSELGGEKIDIIEWNEDPAKFVERALSPGRILNVVLNEGERSAAVTVASDQYSLAIGKGGQNVRLAAKLTGWRIDIHQEGGMVAPVPTIEASAELPIETTTEDAPEVLKEVPAPEAPVETTEEENKK